MLNPLKCIFPIAIFMGMAASAAQAQDANCNCGEILKQLQAENEQLKIKLAQAEADNKRRTADAQAIEDEIKKLQNNEKTNASKETPPTNSKRLSPNDVKEGLNQIQKRANKCGHHGNLLVSFSVDETGKVINLKTTSGSFNNTPEGQCILDVIQKQQFPENDKPTQGIKYNFILE